MSLSDTDILSSICRHFDTNFTAATVVPPNTKIDVNSLTDWIDLEFPLHRGNKRGKKAVETGDVDIVVNAYSKTGQVGSTSLYQPTILTDAVRDLLDRVDIPIYTLGTSTVIGYVRCGEAETIPRGRIGSDTGRGESQGTQLEQSTVTVHAMTDEKAT